MSGRSKWLSGACCAAALSVTHAVAAAEDCRTASRVAESGQTAVSVSATSIEREPLVLGFNLEVAPFERDFWDPATQKVQAPVRAALTQFRAPLIRYPGGTPSNRIDLLATVGEERPPQLLVGWLGPRPVHFGLREYARFAAELGSPGWLVLNVTGVGAERQPADELAVRNRRVVDLFRAEHALLRVELGNEPFFPRHGMAGAEYAARSLPTIKQLREVQPAVRAVVALAGFDMGPMKAAVFNAAVLDELAGADVDYSLHYYYDGPPGGPPLPSVLRNLCERLQWIEARTGKEPVVWVTEHGRWPGGKSDDPGWKRLWPASYNLGAALSVAEFVIAIAPWPQVRGAFLHGMGAAGGPWHQLDRTAQGELVPSATFLTQSLLQALQGTEVMPTLARSPFVGVHPTTRAVAFRRSDTGLSLLMTRRDDGDRAIRLSMPELAGRVVRYALTELHGMSLAAANTHASPRVLSLVRRDGEARFDATGDTVLPTRGPAVVLIAFEPNL